MSMTSAEIRQAFLDYFSEFNHSVVSSSSLVPSNDPTLLFTNAGMVQFKDTFLGIEKRDYTRAATSQKVMRVSGKHNDLENVGPSPRHHTFFEMLGNFSFGDYFKEEAIKYAWEFVTVVLKLPTERLWASIYTDDDEAFELWQKYLPADRILRFGKEENFWSMGDTGPCGPCSEIHYYYGDIEKQTPEGVNRDDEYLEIWNLVFMQFERDSSGTMTPLPKPSIDTGMGLERVAALMQGKTNNYDTDLFTPIMDRTQELLGHADEERQAQLTAYRVIADHGRAITFMIGDGVMPGNEGRASVLRLILRRAARYGRLLGFDGPFLAKIADKVIDEMGHHYIELKARRQFILNVITQEEERFLKTFANGLVLIADLVEKLKDKGKKTIPGDEVFKLYATYGFPKDLTRLIAEEEYDFGIDEAGYEKAFKQHTEVSGGGSIGEIEVDLLQTYADLFEQLKADGKLSNEGVVHKIYEGLESDSTVLAILRDGEVVERAGEGQKIGIVLEATPFYVDAGGQVSDFGTITKKDSWQIEVTDVTRPINGLILHQGLVTSGDLTVGDTALAAVNSKRRWDIMRNHTATHVLHRELRRTLGDHVVQKGSLVAPDRLRFDFSHGQMVTAEELAEIEQAVNEAILADYPVVPNNQTYDDLRQDIADGKIMALFGEKYGDVVRVVRMGSDEAPYSKELCGGTHVNSTAQIGALHITSEGSAAAGIRRIEAVTGRAAQNLIQNQLTTLGRTATVLGVLPENVDQRVEILLSQLQDKEKEIKALQRKLARSDFESLLAQAHTVNDVNVISLKVDAPDVGMLREMSDWFRDKLGSAVVVLGTVSDDKPLIIATVTDDLTKRGLHAGKIVKSVAQVVGGGGGGKPTMAQAGGKDVSRMDEALAKVDTLVEEMTQG